MLTVLTPPAADPVSVAELAAHLRLASGFADADPAADPALAQSLAAATDQVERRAGVALITQRLRWRVEAWPLCSRRVRLPVGPVGAVVSIATLAPDGTPAYWPDTDWHLSPSGAPDVFSHAFDAWPVIPHGGAGEVVFDAGYGPTGESIPASLRHAVLLLAAHYFERPAATDKGLEPLPYGIGALIGPFASAPRL